MWKRGNGSSEHGLGEWMYFAPIPLAATPSGAHRAALTCWPVVQPFGINARVMRIETQCAKGYDLADFNDALARF